jgi:aminoglycoside 3-N-acetyltransferase
MVSIFIDENKLQEQLTAAFHDVSGPLLLHTDLLRVGIVERMKPREEICIDYERIVLNTCEGRPLLIPTFNYDFCRNGVYDLARSIGQVGAFSAYVGTRYASQRSRTPVFNFCIFNGPQFDRKEVTNPFGTDSTFARLHSLDGTIAFMGASFESNTFLHYVEESLQVPYRYIKVFSGEIIENDLRSEWQLDYRVRPLKPLASEYDWLRLTDELQSQGILITTSAGNGDLLFYYTADLFDYWTSRMKADPHYLLTDRSRLVAEKLYRRFGDPLTFESMESV